MFFGTGFGPTTPSVPAGQIVTAPAPLANPSQLFVTIGGVPVRVQWAGLVAPGEYQLNVQLPAVPNGDQPVIAYIGGSRTIDGITIPIQS